MTRLQLTREQILSYRRQVGTLDTPLPPGADSLRNAAWAGLQDSMPRAALLSLHARVEGIGPETWDDPSLVQIWGPRFSAYVVAAEDRGVFTMGRTPDSAAGRGRAEDIATRLADLLGDDTTTYREAGKALGVNPNYLRYATTTGTVLIRWEGSGSPTIRSVPAPEATPDTARLELARRHLHVLGPSTAEWFAKWAGVKPNSARARFESLQSELIPVQTPIGDAWILSEDEEMMRATSPPPAPARLLPSGDAYYLLWGEQREMLVPDRRRRDQLWTSRVWPGAVLVAGEVAGTWRRAGNRFTIDTWNDLDQTTRDAVEAEAMSLPLADLDGGCVVAWAS